MIVEKHYAYAADFEKPLSNKPDQEYLFTLLA